MSQFITIIMVIMMVFSSVAGLNAGKEEPSSFEAKISVDGAQVSALTAKAEMPAAAAAEAEETEAAAEETPDMPTIITDLFSVLSIKGYADKEKAEFGVFANDNALLTLGVRNTEAGATLASSALGSNVVSVSRMMLEMLQKQMMSSMTQGASGVDIESLTGKLQEIDQEQITKDFLEVMGTVGTAIAEKTGEAETGEFTVDGFTFAVKTPVNITYEELMELVLTNAKDLLGRESMKPVIEATTSASPNSDPIAAIDKALENLKAMPEEEKYDLTMASYAGEDGVVAYYAADVSREASEDGSVKAVKTHAGIGTLEGETRVIVTAEDGTAIDATIFSAEDGTTRVQASVHTGEADFTLDAAFTADAADVTVNVGTGDMPVKVHLTTARDGDRSNILAEAFLNGAEAPAAILTISAGKGGEPLCVYEGEGIEEIAFESLMNTEDTTASTKLTTTIMMGLMKAITTLKESLPETTGNWVFTQLSQMMTSGR